MVFAHRKDGMPAGGLFLANMGKRLRESGRIWLSGLFVLGILFPACAQTRAQRSRNLQDLYGENMSVSLVPLPLFFHGFRIDYDCRLKDNLWLQVAPQYNCKRKGALTRTDGFCLDVNARYYVFGSDARGFYVASGLAVDFNRIAEAFYGSGMEDGQVTDFYQVDATRLGGQVLIGYQLGLWPRAVMDFYVGAAYRYAIHSFLDEASQACMQGIEIKPWNFQYGGLYLQAGIRIGLML